METWLQHKFESIEALRERSRENIIASRPEWAGTKYDRPGGARGDEFDAFASKAKDGDELWWFKSPLESWQNMCGRAGYAILRDGKVIATYVSKMS